MRSNAKRKPKSPAVVRLEKRVAKLERALERSRNERRWDQESFKLYASDVAPVPNLEARSPDRIRMAVTCQNMLRRECPLCPATLPEHSVRVDESLIVLLCPEAK